MCGVYGSHVGVRGGGFVGLFCQTSRSSSGLPFSVGDKKTRTVHTLVQKTAALCSILNVLNDKNYII